MTKESLQELQFHPYIAYPNIICEIGLRLPFSTDVRYKLTTPPFYYFTLNLFTLHIKIHLIINDAIRSQWGCNYNGATYGVKYA